MLGLGLQRLVLMLIDRSEQVVKVFASRLVEGEWVVTRVLEFGRSELRIADRSA